MPTPGTSTMAGSAPRRAGLSGVGVAVVVGLVVLAVGGVEFLQPGDGVLDRGVGGQVQDQRLDLGAQEVVRAGGAQRAQPRVLGGFEEVQDDGVIAEVPQLRLVRGRQARGSPAPARRPSRGALPPAAHRSRAAWDRRARRGRCRAMYCSAWSMIHSELASASSLVAPQAVMPCPPRMVPMACGLASLIAAMSRPSWNPGRRHGTQTTLSPKIFAVSASPSTAVAMAMPGVRVQVVHVRGVHEPVHGGVDRRRGAALAVQAVIKRRHHLVLALHARVDVLQRLQPVQAQHREVLAPAAYPGPRRSPSPKGAGRPRPLPGPSPCPSPRCCRRRSWCSACPRPGGWNGQSGLQQSC